MAENIKEYDDEIDLLSLFQIIWEGKWKIASIMAISLLSVFGFNIIKPNTNFTATTEIKPITTVEIDKYSLFNSSLKIIVRNDINNKEYNIFEITKESLLNSYIEKLQEGTLLATGVEKFNLINKDDFNSETDYREAIEKFVSGIEIIKSINEDGKAKDETRLNHVLSGEYNDEDKWKQLLFFVKDEGNKSVKNTIINRFETIVSVQRQKKNFAIKDIEIKIDNIKKDYERITKNRLAFLSEQAAIARKLDIEKHTNVYQNLATRYTYNKDLKDEKIFMIDTPFYLRGYLAIEEEIKQINARKDKNVFLDDLYELEKQKRELEQDETIKRAEDLFKKMPINQNDFKAMILKPSTTNFETNNKRNLFYALALVLGGMIGVVYVLINKALINRKSMPAQS